MNQIQVSVVVSSTGELKELLSEVAALSYEYGVDFNIDARCLPNERGNAQDMVNKIEDYLKRLTTK